MDLNQRIAQFQNMAEADPTNEMAHYSLGNAYTQAARHREAAESYLRCTELVPDMSKAFQLAADNLIKAGDADMIVAGGVINSPQLLMLSGIGPKEELEAAGIEVVHHLQEGIAERADVVDEFIGEILV